MTLSDLSIRRPVFTTMMSAALVVMGVLGLRSLGTDLFPDVQIPVVVVSVVYRGAGPQELEAQVAKPIEDAVAGISGVDFIHSSSRENAAVIIAQFKLSQDLDRAVQEVRDKVAGTLHLLPRDVDQPKVFRFDIGGQPILTYAASAPGLSSQALRALIEKRLVPTVSQLDGVAEVRVTGGDKREIRVDVDLERAKAVGVAPAQLAQLIGMENLNLPAGRLDLGPTELGVRAMGQLRDVADLRALPVAKSQSGAQVRLDEIASVTDGVAERRTAARLNGSDGVILEIIKQPGTNTVAAADAVRQKIDQLSPSLSPGFKAALLVDQSALIRENAAEVWIALVFGGSMAILIILMFLLDVRGTIISALALPTSVIGTFFVMYLMDYSLNQMTLLALSLAIGLLIDDAVVVREAITHRLDQGQPPAIAASRGTRDVYLAVLATTLSLVAVFVPVAFMPGLVGKFFKQFGVTISAAVLISLFVSFTLDPMLSARFVKRRAPGAGKRPKENPVARLIRAVLDANERWYEKLLRWVLAHQWVTLLLVLAVVASSAWLAKDLKPEFIPAEDRGQFTIDLQLGDGASLTESAARAAQTEAVLATVPEVKDVYSVIGVNGDSNRVRVKVLVGDKQARARGVALIKDELRGKLADALPATKVALLDPPIVEGGGDFFPIMLRVMGPDFAALQAEAERLRAMLQDVPGTADVRMDLSPPKPELQVHIDRTRAHDGELSAAGLAMQLRLALNGQEAGKLREGDDETPIVVRLSEADRGSPEAVRRLDVFTARGVRSVSDVANVTFKDGPSVIERHNRLRQIAVMANMAPGAALGAVVSEFKQRLAAAPLAPGYEVAFDGQMKLMKEQNDAFALVFVLAFAFVYMVLASQFESFKHPFTIVVSVPLALVGAVLGLVLTGHNLSLGAMIGLILLMGLVTKNAILLVDGALQNLRAGDDLHAALMKAGPRRLRPILMTSAAMAIGMVPTALGQGLGSEFRAPMAIAVIGGVITSTFLTLVVVPIVFSFLERLTPRSMRTARDEVAETLDGAGPQRLEDHA